MTNGSANGPARDGWHLAASHATTASPDDAVFFTTWRGTRWPLFKLVLWTGFLTILTLGLYRFWARTRIRRWYWSAIRPGGFPLEYTGTAYEKLLGFMVAVVILAFYIGIVNLILLFLSFSLLSAPGAGYALSFLGLVPLWFFATYRAQRYLLARTRWMSMRFGLEPGAWGYVLRACGHWALTVVTLGLWHPRLRWSLARYRHNRTFFGSQRMAQGGRPTMLYPAFVHVMIGGALTLGALAEGSGGLSDVLEALAPDQPSPDLESVAPNLRMLVLSVPWLLYGFIHYSVEGRRLLIGALKVGDVAFDPRPRVGKVVWITISGNVLRYFGAVGVIMLGALLVVLLAMAAGVAITEASEDNPGAIFEFLLEGTPAWLPVVATAIFYFMLFLIWNVFTQVFLTLPTWRHYASTLRLSGAGHLAAIDQRARDESPDAGGFAEALDVGAAI